MINFYTFVTCKEIVEIEEPFKKWYLQNTMGIMFLIQISTIHDNISLQVVEKRR